MTALVFYSVFHAVRPLRVFVASPIRTAYNEAARRAGMPGRRQGRQLVNGPANMRFATSAFAAIGLAIAALFLGRTAYGEIFVLKSGGRVEGEFLNPEREPGAAYQLRTEEGLRLDLAEGQVNRVIVKSELEREYEAELPKVANTVDGHWAMAEWCKDAGLVALRKRHLAEVIRLDPDHKEARAALGYSLYGAKWMTQEEYLTSQGYVRYKGGWWTEQQKSLDIRNEKREIAQKELRKQIKIWLGQIGGKNSDIAEAGLAAIRDEAAAPALAEILADADQPRSARLLCLEILGKLPPGLATLTLVKLAMDDPSDDLRDKCLDELKRYGTDSVLTAFTSELRSKKESHYSNNARVNRAAYCLQQLGDKDATLPLIEALVTEHFVIVDPAQGGGGVPINLNFGNGPGQGGLGGLNVGSKPKKVKGKVNNPFVLGALTSMYPGVNFHYDTDEWKQWYIETYTSTNVNLRRDP